MSGNRFFLINEYEKSSSNVQTISINAPQVERLYKNVRALKLLVSELDSPLMTEEFRNLERFLNLIMSSVVEYEYQLNDFDLKPLRDLFTELLNTFGPRIKENLEQISKLIPKFIYSDINNYSLNVINKIINGNEDVVIVHYYWTDTEIKMWKNHKNVKLIEAKELVNGNRIFDNLIFMGTPRYFQSFDKIFLAKDVYYLSYDFYHNNFNKKSVIPDNNQINNAIYKNVNFISDT